MKSKVLNGRHVRMLKEMLTRFINGGASLDKEWNSYLQTLDKMNLKGYLYIYQEAYDAHIAKI